MFAPGQCNRRAIGKPAQNGCDSRSSQNVVTANPCVVTRESKTMHKRLFRQFLAVQLTAWAAVGCSGPREAVPAATESSDAPSPQDAFPEAVRAILDKPFKGDFDELVKRRAIR